MKTVREKISITQAFLRSYRRTPLPTLRFGRCGDNFVAGVLAIVVMWSVGWVGVAIVVATFVLGTFLNRWHVRGIEDPRRQVQVR